MDPNATLTLIRALQTELLAQDGTTSYGEVLRMAQELAEATKALDEWMVKGGFFPRDWRPF
jgi:hypothetical protein